ncbi:hypothetical protein KAH37_04035 [bacterium]|nr:hypothetical protein [bacterium]
MRKLTLFLLLMIFAISFASCESEDPVGGGDSDSHTGGDTGDTGDSTTDDNNDTADSADDKTGNDMSPDDDAVIVMDCTPGETLECYSGPSGTQDVGACKAGKMTCIEDGSGWGSCKDEVLPLAEICGDSIDQDCDGMDQTEANAIDIDGDGFTYCEGDCCELGSQCVHPERVGPASFEVAGNNNDDNCNGEVDEEIVCDTGLSQTLSKDDVPGNAIKLAKGMELCDPWLVKATISLTEGPAVENIADDQCCGDNGNCTPGDRKSIDLPMFNDKFQTYMVTTKFGDNLTPHKGEAISILSTGQWDEPTMDFDCAKEESGDMKTASEIPHDWANMQHECETPEGDEPSGEFTDTCGGKYPIGADPIMLTLEAKVPNNANAFSFRVYFLAIEFPQTIEYNDFFVALLDSTYNEKNPSATDKNPRDKNLAMSADGFPLGVKMAEKGIFQVCNNDPACIDSFTKQQAFEPYTQYCQGDGEIVGTGFEAKYETIPMLGDSCGGHGGTGWLLLQGNVVPGETMKLRIAAWEQGSVEYGQDHSYDTTVLLDDFEWHELPLDPGMGGR